MKKAVIFKYFYVLFFQMGLLATANAVPFEVMNNTGVPIRVTVTNDDGKKFVVNELLTPGSTSEPGDVTIKGLVKTNTWLITYTTDKYSYKETIVTMDREKTFTAKKDCEVFSSDDKVAVTINRDNYIISMSSGPCKGTFSGANGRPFYVQNLTGGPITVKVGTSVDGGGYVTKKVEQYLDKDAVSDPGLVPVFETHENAWDISYTADGKTHKAHKSCNIESFDNKVTIDIHKDRYVIAPDKSSNCEEWF